MSDTLQKWFEGIFAERDEGFYPGFFGDLGAGIYGLTKETFASLGCADPDPRFLTHGVFECPPPGGAGERTDWLYVSTGMSNPWGDTPETANPLGPSGLGFEFMMHTRERARWAILVMQWLMAVQLLVATGELEGELLQRFDRVPLGGGIGGSGGVLTHLLAAPPAEGYPVEFTLASGRVDVILLIGISEKESAFARTQGVEGLVQLLKHHGVFPVTDPGRVSVV